MVPFVLNLYLTEVQDPYAVVVLLEKDLIVVDLTQSKYVLPLLQIPPPQNIFYNIQHNKRRNALKVSPKSELQKISSLALSD